MGGALLVINAAHAGDAEHAEEEVIQHYAAEAPVTAEAAYEVLQEGSEEVAELLEKETPDNNDMERIHELSYSLETAVDFLREKNGTEEEATIDAVDEAVQAIHFASENRELETLQKWSAALEETLNEMENS